MTNNKPSCCCNPTAPVVSTAIPGAPTASCCSASPAPAVDTTAKAYLDPVCGMKVSANPDKAFAHEGTTYYFCSAGCLAKFRAAPAAYLKSERAVQIQRPVAIGTIYTCPMHPEIRQDRPGACPKCGMALEPEQPLLDDTENPELADFKQRLYWTLPLTGVVFGLAMFGHWLPWLNPRTESWSELVVKRQEVVSLG